MKKVLVVLFAGLFAMACGGGGSSKKKITPTATQKDQAKGAVTSATKLNSVKTNAASQDAMTGLSEVQANAYALLGSTQAAKAGGLTEAVEAAQSSMDCVKQDGKTITYNNCTFGTMSVNGTITVDADKIAVALTMKMTSPYTLDLTWSGSVTVTDAAINGTLKYDMVMDQSGMKIKGSTTITYGNIALTSGCPTSGTMDIDGNWKADIPNMPSGYSGAGVGSVDMSVTVVFGPNCGDMQMSAG